MLLAQTTVNVAFSQVPEHKLLKTMTIQSYLRVLMRQSRFKVLQLHPRLLRVQQAGGRLMLQSLQFILHLCSPEFLAVSPKR